MSKRIEIYSEENHIYEDGKVGFATIVNHDGKDNVVYGGKENTTKNRQELIGIVYALYYVKKSEIDFDEIDILTTSEYIKSGINKNIHKWITQGEVKANMDCWNIIWKYILKYNSRKKKKLSSSWYDDGSTDEKSDKKREGIEKKLEIKAKYDKYLRRIDDYI